MTLPSVTEQSPSLWKDFLQLGESLLRQPDAAGLAELFEQSIESRLLCKAKIWFAEPYYPLPAERPIDTFPAVNIPPLVQQAFTQRKSVFNPTRSRKKKNGSPCEIALPLITQDFLLGILLVKRPESIPFNLEEIQVLEGMAAFGAVSMQVNRQVTLKNWRYDQISLVRSVSSQIANVLDLDELCKRVTNLIQCSFDFYNVTIFTLEDGRRELKFRASSLECESISDHPLFAVRFGEGLIGNSAQTGKEFVIRDVSKEPLFRFIAALPRTRSEAVLPLVIENRILGVLDIQSEKNESFHENDMLVLRSLADNIALAVENARLYYGLEKRASQLAAINEINQALSSILELEPLLDEVVSVIYEQFNIPFVHIFSVHGGLRKITFQAGSGARSKRLKSSGYSIDLDVGEGIIPHVARTGQTLLANNVTEERLYKPSLIYPQKTKSELAIPLKFGEEVLGVLDLQSDKVNQFGKDDLDLFESLASGIALSIRNATVFRTERWRRKVAESFKEVAGMLSANTALSEMLDKILVELEKNLPCDASAIWLLDNNSTLPEENRPLQIAAVHGTTSKKILSLTEESNTVRRFLNIGLSSNSPVVRKPADPYGPLGAACGYPSNYSSLAIPLRAGNEVLGVLTLAHHAEGRYGPEASAISTTFASYAAVAIQNTRIFTSAQSDAWSSTVLLQVAEMIQSITTINDLFATIVRLTPLLVGIDKCAVFLTSYNKENFELKKWYGFRPTKAELRINETDGIAFFKLKTTLAPVFVSDPKAELNISSIRHSQKQNTLVLLPLVSHGELQGAFLVSHKTSNDLASQSRFNDQTLAILQGIAQQSSVALENVQLLESRQEEAYITAVLLQVAQAVVSLNNLDDILETLIQLMPILAGVNACVIYLWDKTEGVFLPTKAFAPTREEEEGLFQRVYKSNEFPLLDRIASTGQMSGCLITNPKGNVKKWNSLDCFDNMNIQEVEYGNWLLGFPLVIKGELFGAIVARETNVPAAFHQKRIELLNGVAQQTALAIQNERLKEEMVDRERIEREFQLARQIQKTFLPESIPSSKGWDLDLRWHTAREVGGDFYDAFRLKNGCLAIVIADVSDKGMPAALYMTVTRTLIRATAQTTSSPAKILERVNELLVSDAQDGMFVTAIVAVLNTETGILEITNAGHNLPLIYRSEIDGIEKLPKGGIALGVLKGAKYEVANLQINKGDTLLFYTDGVTEAFSSDGEQFSETRLCDAMAHSRGESADHVLSELEDQIKSFRKGEPPSDDLTMIAVHRLK